MHFLLKLNLENKEKIRVVDLADILTQTNLIALPIGQRQLARYNEENKSIFVIGDLVTHKNVVRNYAFFKQAIDHNIVHQFGGFFYLIFLDHISNHLKIYSSLFNMLPIYYFKKGNQIVISSNTDLIISSTKQKFEIDKQYLLERALFNYGLFDRTYFKDIKLIKTNHYIEIKDGFSEKQIFEITDLFVTNFKKGKNVLNNIAELFIDSVEKYLPDEKYTLSFTGGFDGRTLLAVSKYFNKDFSTYSFGTKDSQDVLLPLKHSKELGIEFNPIYLDSKIFFENSCHDGIELIEKTEGYASFGRAHYLNAAKLLSKETNYLLTGNFGSELFRAMHNPGVMIAQELIDVFKNDDRSSWIYDLRNAPRLKFLKKNIYNTEFESLIEELKTFKNKFKSLPKNQFFYIYVFTEIFRKYFGPEIYMQRYFLNNRTPYLDFAFIKELFKTYYCGIYSDFFTDNPIKRYKGQLVYPYIIKKTFPPLLKLKTAKGYCPNSLLNNMGKIKLVYNLIKKKMYRNINRPNDPFAVEKAFIFNANYWAKTIILNEYYNEKYMSINNIDIKNDLDIFINILSSNYYLFKVTS